MPGRFMKTLTVHPIDYQACLLRLRRPWPVTRLWGTAERVVGS